MVEYHPAKFPNEHQAGIHGKVHQQVHYLKEVKNNEI